MTPEQTESPKEATMDDLYQQLSARIGETVAMYGREDFVVVAVHSREARVEAPKTRKHPAAVKYPKLRTLAAALGASEIATQAESVAA